MSATPTGSAGDPETSQAVSAAASELTWQCVRCEEETSLRDSHPTNAKKPFDNRKCKCCSNTDRSLQRSFEGSKKAKKNWADKSPEDKKAFYAARKRAGKGSPFEMQDVEVSVGEVIEKIAQDDEFDVYMPFGRWRAAHYWEHPTWTDAEWLDLWNQTLDDPDTPKTWRRNQWCVGEFGGVTVSAAQRTAHQTNVKRKAEAQTADEMADCLDAARGQADKWKRTVGLMTNPIQSGVPKLHTDLPGEVSFQLGSSRTASLLQRDLAKRADAEAGEAADALDQKERIPKPPTPQKSKAVLNFEFKTKVSAESSKVSRAIQAREDRMESVFLDANDKFFSCVESDEKTELEEMIKNAREHMLNWKKAAQKECAAWERLAHGDADEFKASMTTISEEVAAYMQPKKFAEHGTSHMEVMKNLETRLRQLKKAQEGAEKAKTAQSAVQNRADSLAALREPDLIAPLRSYMMGHPEQGMLNCSEVVGDFFSSPQKIVFTRPECYKAGLVDKLTTHSYYMSHKEWVASFLDKQGMAGANSDIVAAKSYTQIQTWVNAMVDARLLKKIHGDSTVTQCFNFQFWQNSREFHAVMCPTRCLPECRLTTEGCEIVAGVKASALTGNDLREKFQLLSSMPCITFLALAKKSGFIAKSSPGTLLVVDPQYICITIVASDTPCLGLRWSFIHSEKELPALIDAMVLAFPSLSCDPAWGNLKKACE